jgi:outer membrane protein TolC
MNIQNKILIILLLFLPIVSTAQDIETVLKQISENNSQLKAYKELMKAEKYEAGIGLLPGNPTVSYGYFPGSPSSVGNKKSWEVSQEIDFPSVYAYRRGVLKNKRLISDKKYEIGRQEILLDAKLSVLEYIYLKKSYKMISSRLSMADKLMKGIEKKFSSGESNVIEYNKVKILSTNLKKDLAIVESKIRTVQEHIKYLNGGIMPQLPESVDVALLIGERDLIDNMLANLPQLDILNKEVKLSDKQIRLSRSETLPKFQIGYESEDAEGVEFSGIKVGMSIPLWGDRNKVKAAKANAEYLKAKMNSTKANIIAEYKQNYNLAVTLRQSIKDLKGALTAEIIKDKLKKAFEAGELSQHEYFGELEYYFETEDSVIQLEKEYAQLVAKLYSYKL